MLNLNSILLFSENPTALIEFYRKILQRDAKWSGGQFSGFEIGSGWLVIGPHDKIHGKNSAPERIIFNIETDDVEGETRRLKQMGVTVIQEPYHPGEASTMTIATFADPDRNYFQFATPMR